MGYFIDPCGYFPQVPLGPDIVEIHRKKPAELFGQIIDGFDTAVQQLGNITGKQVDVLYEYTANRNMDDKVGNKPGGPDGVQFNKFKPYPYIENMGGIGLYLPIVSDTSDHRRLKAQINDAIDEQFYKIAVIGFINTFPHIQNTVQCRCRILSGSGL